MNQHFEITMFTYKFCADFGMQKSFKDQRTRPDTSRYQFFAHFPLKELCTAKSTPGIDENPQLSKESACRTQYFERILHVQRQMYGNR